MYNSSNQSQTLN